MENQTKGILSIFGALMLMFMFGSNYCWGGLNMYFISYLKYNGVPAVTNNDGLFLMPIASLSLSIFVAGGGYLMEAVGVKLL